MTISLYSNGSVKVLYIQQSHAGNQMLTNTFHLNSTDKENERKETRATERAYGTYRPIVKKSKVHSYILISFLSLFFSF